MNDFLPVLFSPIGPSLVLLAGALIELLVGRWVRRPAWQMGIALVFTGLAAVVFISLQFQGVVPSLGRPWQPLLQRAVNLYWISDGWNYYVAGLILLLGGLGILLDRNPQPAAGQPQRFHAVMAMNLAVLAGSLLFVNSGNLLTALLTWVFLDFTILLRSAVEPVGAPASLGLRLRSNEARILSLVGALLLLIGLRPAGAAGPAQEFASGQLPVETLVLMLAAAAIRAGIYPLHVWLLPRSRSELNPSERLLDQMAPMLAGLWLFGWTFQLGGAGLMTDPVIVILLCLTLLASAVAAWTAGDQMHHVTFVLITAAGVAVLAGALAATPGPSGMIWGTTAFALGGGLWLVGDQVWRGWRWQIPVSVGALALAFVPFTPGFLALPALASLLARGAAYVPSFFIFVAAFGIQIAALLRSWSTPEQAEQPKPPQGYMVRLLIATLCLGLPLAVSGILPQFTETLASIPYTIPPGMGNPPSAVAAPIVWITLGLPLLLGLGLIWLRPRVWPRLGAWPNHVSQVTQLEWLFRLSMWSVDHIALLGNNALRVVEGAGYLGWFLVVLLIAFLLVR